MFYVYVLVNESKIKTYVGSTENLNKRLEEHNAGKVKSSKPYRPYKILHYEEFDSLAGARRREVYYKSTSGRRKLSEILQRNHS
ncbi:MAG: hypothetical protein A3D87_08435 [Omnitrophica WOR_2 bacterium RIFCSPHIGHO2_02_FULL_50_17]|nr:MAG: hypothetical protein A3D87_08435 [Omnitrophica WOR_2 bacterium RIFCSPHIGHO2_02_FULL_50_17]